MSRKVKLELLPHERAVVAKWNHKPEIQDQLAVCASSDDIATIVMTAVDVNWLASDLTHAIVKKGCRDADVIDLSERLDFVNDTGDGSLEAWYD